MCYSLVLQIWFCLNDPVMRYRPLSQRVGTWENFGSPPCSLVCLILGPHWVAYHLLYVEISVAVT